jgi:hypothetical protein
MCQPEEIEGLRSTGMNILFSLVGCKPSKAKMPGFVRMQFQTELRESVQKLPQEPFCIEVILEAQHKVISCVFRRS